MKPIIIFKEKNNDGTMSFTQEEIEKLLSDAYNQGYSDGSPKGTTIYPTLNDKDTFTITPSPSIPSTPFPYSDTNRNNRNKISTNKEMNVSLS